jgi:hypothetical protein
VLEIILPLCNVQNKRTISSHTRSFGGLEYYWITKLLETSWRRLSVCRAGTHAGAWRARQDKGREESLGPVGKSAYATGPPAVYDPVVRT